MITGCTKLLISEQRYTGLKRKPYLGEYLAQVIFFLTFLNDSSLVLLFQVEKMRGLAIDKQPRTYEISAKGIKVQSIETVYR